MTRDVILQGTTPTLQCRCFLVDIVAIVTPEPGCWWYLVVYEQSDCLLLSQTETILHTVLGWLSWPQWAMLGGKSIYMVETILYWQPPTIAWIEQAWNVLQVSQPVHARHLIDAAHWTQAAPKVAWLVPKLLHSSKLLPASSRWVLSAWGCVLMRPASISISKVVHAHQCTIWWQFSFRWPQVQAQVLMMVWWGCWMEDWSWTIHIFEMYIIWYIKTYAQ